MQNIRRAAHGGFQSSWLTNQLETFIASQESTARLLDTYDTGTREILTFCALDLILTTPTSSTNLMEVAMKYLNASRKLDNTRHSDYYRQLLELVQHVGQKEKKSIPQILCDATLPLNLIEWVEKMRFWKSLAEKIVCFQDSQCAIKTTVEEELDSAGFQIFEEIVQLCGDKGDLLQKILSHFKILQLIVPIGKFIFIN